MSEILQMDGEAPFDDLEGNGAFYRLVNKVLGKLAPSGLATLSGGSATVTDARVKADSVILLTPRGNTAAGTLDIQTITAGTSFVIRSSNGADARDVGWQIINSGA